MNEVTLNALINLYALFTAISESNKTEAIRGFSLYLHQHFGITGAGEYHKLFIELLDLYGVESKITMSLDLTAQVSTISSSIRNRLPRDEQVLIYLRFLELTQSGNPERAEKLFDILAGIFEISRSEQEKFNVFIFSANRDQLNSPDFLLIDREPDNKPFRYKHLCNPKLNGQLLFMRSPLIGHFIFNYRGTDELTCEGNPVIPDRFYAFKEGSIIRGLRISPIYFTDVAALFSERPLKSPFIFSGEEIEFRFKGSTNGIHRFSFRESSGQLIAIMGGSGVGKSTLLNLLNGTIPLQQGVIRINDTDISKEKDQVQRLIGYVPQHDLLFEELTVWENLFYSARLSFDHLTRDETEAKVDEVLQALELGSVKNLKVGSPFKKLISGGQRKRLNIAIELIREPAILFVDEPTSGLSSTDSERVMLLLKRESRLGKLIIVNIHQPSSALFKLFDKLWIIDTGGYPVYTGHPLDAITYFKREANQINPDDCECPQCGNVNPGQILEIIESKKIDPSGNFLPERRFTPDQWYNLYRQREINKELPPSGPSILPVSESHPPGILNQLKIFFCRNLNIKLADRQYLLVSLLEAPVLALIIGFFTRYVEGDHYLLYENKSLISYLFMSIVVTLFMGMSVSAEEIIRDRLIIRRESYLQLSRFSYLNSKITFLILLSAFQALSFIIPGNIILQIKGMNMAYWLVLFSLAANANLMGLNISSAFNSVVTVYVLIPLLLIPQLLLCGVIVKFDDLQSRNGCRDVVPLAGEAMVSRWAFEALAVEQFRNNRYMIHLFEAERSMVQAGFRGDILISELMGLTDLTDGRIRMGQPQEDISRNLKILKNEIEKLDRECVAPPFSKTNLLTAERFNHDIAVETKRHLEKLQSYHKEQFRKFRNEKDRIIQQLSGREGDSYLYRQKMANHNQSLEKLMLNSDIIKFFRETSCGYMQKIAPVYKEPEFNNGRAHFLAPEKKLFHIKINTLTFNLSVIWMITLFLYIALYNNWLKKIVQRWSHG